MQSNIDICYCSLLLDVAKNRVSQKNSTHCLCQIYKNKMEIELYCTNNNCLRNAGFQLFNSTRLEQLCTRRNTQHAKLA